MARKPSNLVAYKIRIRPELRRRIERAAKDNKVSANREIVVRLDQSFLQKVQQTTEAFQQKNLQTTEAMEAMLQKIAGYVGYLEQRIRELSGELVRMPGMPRTTTTGPGQVSGPDAKPEKEESKT